MTTVLMNGVKDAGKDTHMSTETSLNMTMSATSDQGDIFIDTIQLVNDKQAVELSHFPPNRVQHDHPVNVNTYTARIIRWHQSGANKVVKYLFMKLNKA